MQARPDLPQPAIAGWPLRAVLDLGALVTAPGCARAWTREILWEWRLTSLANTAELIVSELTTNSVLASPSPDQPPIRLILVSDHQQLVVLVRDFDPGVPVPRSASAEDESGRGLLLVQSLSGQFGWYRPEDGTPGKVVWAVCALEAPDCIPGSAGRNLEDIPGSMAYLESKGKGDRSMPLKRQPGPGIRDGVPQDPRNMSES